MTPNPINNHLEQFSLRLSYKGERNEFILTNDTKRIYGSVL